MTDDLMDGPEVWASTLALMVRDGVSVFDAVTSLVELHPEHLGVICAAVAYIDGENVRVARVNADANRRWRYMVGLPRVPDTQGDASCGDPALWFGDPIPFHRVQSRGSADDADGEHNSIVDDFLAALERWERGEQ
jgi:hypothetical protein